MNIVIKGNRISLVHFENDMAFDVWQNSLDENNRKFVPDEVFETYEETAEVIKTIIKNYQTGECPLIYAVIRNDDNANMGYVQLVEIVEGFEVGYHIAQKYTNQGYASEALDLFIKYIKGNISIQKLYGIALFSNKASIRVLLKNGFKIYFEGYSLYQGKRRKIIKSIKNI